MRKLMFLIIASAIAGCATNEFATDGKQDLMIDKQIQPLSRNEVISAVKDCTDNELRAVMLYGKRKINGYTTDIVVDVTCAPKY